MMYIVVYSYRGGRLSEEKCSSLEEAENFTKTLKGVVPVSWVLVKGELLQGGIQFPFLRDEVV